MPSWCSPAWLGHQHSPSWCPEGTQTLKSPGPCRCQEQGRFRLQRPSVLSAKGTETGMLSLVVTDEGSLLPNSRPVSPTTYSMSHLGCQDASQQYVQTHTHTHVCTLTHVQTHRHTHALTIPLLSPQPFQLLRPKVLELRLTPLFLSQPLTNPSADGPAPSSKPIRLAPSTAIPSPPLASASAHHTAPRGSF